MMCRHVLMFCVTWYENRRWQWTAQTAQSWSNRDRKWSNVILKIMWLKRKRDLSDSLKVKGRRQSSPPEDWRTSETSWGNIRVKERGSDYFTSPLTSVPVLPFLADQHCEWRRQTLLLPPLHLRRGHREHPAGVQRLPGHHPENAPAAMQRSGPPDVPEGSLFTWNTTNKREVGLHMGSVNINITSSC